MGKNRIVVGPEAEPIFELDDDAIIACDVNLSVNLAGEELAIDTLECDFEFAKIGSIFCPADSEDGLETQDGVTVTCLSGDISVVSEAAYATPISYWHGQNYIGKFYVSTLERSGQKSFRLTGVSAIGILDSYVYYGRMLNKTPLSDVVSNILMTDGMTVDATEVMTELNDALRFGPGVADLAVSGWLPVSSKREALHTVLFACNLTMRHTESGEILITGPVDAENVTIQDDDIYEGGSVELPETVNRVEVAEHAFRHIGGEPVVLYDNTDQAISKETVVQFRSAPIVVATLQTTGTLAVLAATANAAIVDGIGTLTGLPYAHTTTIVTRGKSVINGKTISCTENTLIGLWNVDSIADKLWSYYKDRTESSQNIVLRGQMPGRQYQFLTPFGDRVSGYLSNMTISASGICKANCTFAYGYTPPTPGNFLSRRIMLTGSGQWVVPSEIMLKDNPRIRVVLIGGGQGGYSGYKGADGSTKYFNVNTGYAVSILGGKNGKNGNAGRVLQIEIAGKDLKPYYAYRCGTGGTGGNACESETDANEGTIGTASIFGNYTSDAGAVLENGFADFVTGDVFAWQYNNSWEYSVFDYFSQSNDPVYAGGTSPANVNWKHVVFTIFDTTEKKYKNVLDLWNPTYDEFLKRFSNSYGWIEMGIGFPGGAAAAEGGISYGQNGIHGYLSGKTAYTGTGGNGADATKIPASPLELRETNYGWGGMGGFGGGAGGSCGMGPSSTGGWNIKPGGVGKGGKGGPGGPGAPGCIIIYY